MFKVPVPRVTPASKNITDPIGRPMLPLTVAVKVTVLPARAGFCEEVSVVVLFARTVCKRTLELLPAKVPSPL